MPPRIFFLFGVLNGVFRVLRFKIGFSFHEIKILISEIAILCERSHIALAGFL